MCVACVLNVVECWLLIVVRALLVFGPSYVLLFAPGRVVFRQGSVLVVVYCARVRRCLFV